jgi:hypothetical protein
MEGEVGGDGRLRPKKSPPRENIQGALMAVHHDHGHTPAAWTGSIIAFVGFCAGAVFMVAAQPVPFWVSMGVILLGPLVGGVMKLMGLGTKEQPAAHNARQHAAAQQTSGGQESQEEAHAAAGA